MALCMTTSGMTEISHEVVPEVESLDMDTQHASKCVDSDDPEVHYF